MSILIDNLVEELISGLKHRLQSHEHSLDMENEKILKELRNLEPQNNES